MVNSGVTGDHKVAIRQGGASSLSVVQSPTRLDSKRLLMSNAESAGVGEAPSARDRGHGVHGRIGRLQITVGKVKAQTPQVLQRRCAEMAADMY